MCQVGCETAGTSMMYGVSLQPAYVDKSLAELCLLRQFIHLSGGVITQ